MNTYTYTRRPEFNGRGFKKAIKAALPGKRFHIDCGEDCVIDFREVTLTRDEIDDLDTAVAEFSGLEDAKARRLASADVRTRKLFDLFLTTGVGNQPDITAAAGVVRNAINAATTQPELDAVVDSR